MKTRWFYADHAPLGLLLAESSDANYNISADVKQSIDLPDGASFTIRLTDRRDCQEPKALGEPEMVYLLFSMAVMLPDGTDDCVGRQIRIPADSMIALRTSQW